VSRAEQSSTKQFREQQRAVDCSRNERVTRIFVTRITSPPTHPGVVTKLDIMDRGTNAVNTLKNAVVPLRLGYVAVVNRSQADINSRKSMVEARR